MALIPQPKVRELVKGVAGVHGYAVPMQYSSLTVVMGAFDSLPWRERSAYPAPVSQTGGTTELDHLMPWTARVVRRG